MSFNALNIDFYLCGDIHSKGYAPDEQTTALLQTVRNGDGGQASGRRRTV